MNDAINLAVAVTLMVIPAVLKFNPGHIKRSAHSDGSVIYDIVVAVGFSFACAVSEIGFRASDDSGFQNRIH